MSIAGFRWSGVPHQKYSGNIASDLANLHFYWKQLFLLKRKKSVKSPLTAQTSGIFKKLRQISFTSLKIKPNSKRDNYYMLRSIAFWWECFTNDDIIKIKNHSEKSSGEIFRLKFWSFYWKTEIYSQIFISQYLMSVWCIRLITNLTKFVIFLHPLFELFSPEIA